MTRLERREHELAVRITRRFQQAAACSPSSDENWKHHCIATRLNRKRRAAIAKAQLRGEKD